MFFSPVFVMALPSQCRMCKRRIPFRCDSARSVNFSAYRGFPDMFKSSIPESHLKQSSQSDTPEHSCMSSFRMPRRCINAWPHNPSRRQQRILSSFMPSRCTKAALGHRRTLSRLRRVMPRSAIKSSCFIFRRKCKLAARATGKHARQDTKSPCISDVVSSQAWDATMLRKFVDVRRRKHASFVLKHDSTPLAALEMCITFSNALQRISALSGGHPLRVYADSKTQAEMVFSAGALKPDQAIHHVQHRKFHLP
jgi:hypothetical protein